MENEARVVLVIDYSIDWSKAFRGKGRIKVEEAEWAHLEMRFEGGKLIVDIEGNPNGYTRAARSQRTVYPDCVLVRNFPLALRGVHYRNLCNCLMISRVLCVNGAQCVLATTDRAWLYAELLRVQDELGKDCFPVVELDFYSNMLRGGRGFEPLKRGDTRTVVKVGSTNAGFGKSLVDTQQQREDLWSILACSNEYVTEEPFIEHEYEYRVQVIGEHVRCFKRNSDSSWKNNTGNLQFMSLAVEERHKVKLLPSCCVFCANLYCNDQRFGLKRVEKCLVGPITYLRWMFFANRMAVRSLLRLIRQPMVSCMSTRNLIVLKFVI
jgi:hypothetical protein